jgi:glycerol-3-phosphate dehydrogenase (NAD+)
MFLKNLRFLAQYQRKSSSNLRLSLNYQCQRNYQEHQSTIKPLSIRDKSNALFSGSTKGKKIKVGVVGGGNWGTAVARKVAFNLSQIDHPFIDPLVKQWVYEETLPNGEKLTDIINKTHENPKYLSGIYLPSNIQAIPSLYDVVKDSNVLLFVLPHSYLLNILDTLNELKKQHSDFLPSSTIAVSFIKGVQVGIDGNIRRYSEIIQHSLGIDHIAAVMGANVAMDIAHDSFAETTVACANEEIGTLIAGLFHSENFRTQITNDISTVELCGALKNVIALAAGEYC